jgi:Flp pilus assembly protein TadG
MRRRDSYRNHHRRSGAVMVETALVLPALFMFLAGTITVGMGIYYYEQVASLAREGARQASVHGSDYAAENNTTAWGTTEITNAVTALATGLNPADITVTASPSTVGDPGTTIDVTVSYSWTPLMYISGPITLSSTSELVVTY